ncbi:MAG: hypothetical protein LRY69_04650 [Gammaproteobacteria bacterium]|nr:hypothetical protein [Gammaproteobacteria bacterium]
MIPVIHDFSFSSLTQIVIFSLPKAIPLAPYAVKYFLPMCTTLHTKTRPIDKEDIQSLHDIALNIALQYYSDVNNTFQNMARHLINANPYYAHLIIPLVNNIKIIDIIHFRSNNESDIRFSVHIEKALLMPIFRGEAIHQFCNRFINSDRLDYPLFFVIAHHILHAFIAMSANGSRHGDVNSGNVLININNKNSCDVYIIDTEFSCFIGENLTTTQESYLYWSPDRVCQKTLHFVREREYHDAYGLAQIFIELVECCKLSKTDEYQIPFILLENLKKRLKNTPYQEIKL